MLNFDGGVEAVKLILKFQTSSVSDGTNLYVTSVKNWYDFSFQMCRIDTNRY